MILNPKHSLIIIGVLFLVINNCPTLVCTSVGAVLKSLPSSQIGSHNENQLESLHLRTGLRTILGSHMNENPFFFFENLRTGQVLL
jgi:hypothetical protein